MHYFAYQNLYRDPYNNKGWSSFFAELATPTWMAASFHDKITAMPEKKYYRYGSQIDGSGKQTNRIWGLFLKLIDWLGILGSLMWLLRWIENPSGLSYDLAVYSMLSRYSVLLLFLAILWSKLSQVNRTFYGVSIPLDPSSSYYQWSDFHQITGIAFFRTIKSQKANVAFPRVFNP